MSDTNRNKHLIDTRVNHTPNQRRLFNERAGDLLPMLPPPLCAMSTPGPLREFTLHWLNIDATAADGQFRQAVVAGAVTLGARVAGGAAAAPQQPSRPRHIQSRLALGALKHITGQLFTGTRRRFAFGVVGSHNSQRGSRRRRACCHIHFSERVPQISGRAEAISRPCAALYVCPALQREGDNIVTLRAPNRTAVTCSAYRPTPHVPPKCHTFYEFLIAGHERLWDDE